MAREPKKQMNDPDDPGPRGGGLFVDRVTESAAFLASLAQHRSRIDLDLIDADSLRNVLTFYGEGGVGKTELSKRLGAWITDGLGSNSEWGPPPPTTVDAVVRWDLNESQGNLDPLPLLIALRRQLGTIAESWPAFDLAFSAFYRSLRPGTDIDLRTPRAGTTTLSEVLAGLIGDAVAITGVVATNAVGAVAIGAGRSLVARARTAVTTRRVLLEYPSLEKLIADCEAMSGAIEDTSNLAGRLAFMLTRQIEALDPTERPLVVVFVDHMERLQRPGERHLGEATLNRLISRLPYFLFVVTGRQSLRWHTPRPELPVSGADRWPLMSTEAIPADEPRQHAIGNLSAADAEVFLRTSFEADAVHVEPGLTEQLARTSDGWPLHLQTIVGVARERSRQSAVLTAADLGGPLPALVERLLGDLPSDVADAFRAACLLPYFDVDFVAAAGELRSGAVEQLVKRQVVRPNESTTYPYRVHDTLRAIVRATGSAAAGGWGDAEWSRHARLALQEARARFERAMQMDDDLAAIHSLALGLNVAAENQVYDDWLIEGIRSSPNVDKLTTLTSAYPGADAPPDLVDVVEFLHLRAKALAEDITDDLAVITAHRTAISSTAGLWRAYDLRKRGRVDEALAQLEELLSDFADRPDLYRNQIPTTLRLARRFGECIDYFPQLTEEQASAHRAVLDRCHGLFRGEESLLERARRSSSRRYQVELMGDTMLAWHRREGAPRSEILEAHRSAVVTGHDASQATCAGVLAEMHLFDDEAFWEWIAELEDLSRRRFEPYRSLLHALVLRAWAANDEVAAERARGLAATVTYRDSSWISTEILFEELGMSLPPLEAQWLEPYDIVRQNWLGVLAGIVERARH